VPEIGHTNLLPSGPESSSPQREAPDAIDALDTIHRSIAFHGTAALPADGNPCLLHIVNQPGEEPLSPSSETQCLTWPLDERRAAVRCFTGSGRAISCCGHGLLCSGAWWSRRWPGDGLLVAGGGEIPCQTRGPVTWLGFSRPDLSPASLPDWLQALYPDSPLVQVTYAGADDGYLLAELEADTDIAPLAAPGASLTSHSGRALLLFCRVSRRAIAGELAHFRYFAPQYATPEDAATGSAMRLLGALLDPAAELGEITALQRSPTGGVLMSRVDHERVWVGGQVSTARSPS
jgi:predicted PhzF superfamily epimerase YddE/YHI9